MGWALRIYTPTGGPHVSGSLIAEYTESSPGGIVGGFRWSRAPHGDCLQMEFAAVPKLVDIPPRAIVHFLVDGQSAFYGFVVRGGALSSSRAEQYVVLGAARLLSQRYAYYSVSASTDTGAIVRNILSQYAHPAIRYDAARVPDTGYTLSRFSAPWVDIATILKDLSGAAGGVAWGVDADGYFYFRPVNTLQAVRYEEANLQYLPVLAEEVWDRVRLIHPPSGYQYLYDAGLGVGAERAVVIPNIQDYMDRPSGAWSWSNNLYTLDNLPASSVDPGLLYDDNPGTGYIVWGESNSQICTGGFTFKGLTFTPSYIPMEVLWVIDAWPAQQDGAYATSRSYSPVVQLSWSGGNTAGLSEHPLGWGWWRIPSGVTSAHISVGEWIPSTNCYAFRVVVVRFAVFTPGVTLARLAQSLVRTPYQEPTEVAVPGYLPPATTLTITGTPSGDVSGPVAEWEYEYSVERGLWTTARVGNKATDPQASAIRILASAITDDQTTRLRASMGG